jgi:hypothetical protein
MRRTNDAGDLLYGGGGGDGDDDDDDDDDDDGQMEVREGFETSFRFRITNPSIRCNIMDDEYTRCRSRGGDGFAFVIQVMTDGSPTICLEEEGRQIMG